LSQLQRILECHGKTNFFRFVINPYDFAQSVENIFYLSFLIRDGKVAWEVEDLEPVICKSFSMLAPVFSITSDCCDAPTDEDFARGVTKQQLIVEFDEELWEVCSIYPTKIFVSLILRNLGCN